MRHDYLSIAKEIVLKRIDKTQFDVFLFGSRADGTSREMSDIDIGICGKEKLNILVMSGIEEALEESIVPFKIDIVDFSNVSEQFKKEAMSTVVYWNKA